jgi:hypothetical protein
VTFSKTISHNIVSSTFQNPCTYNEAGGVASLTYKAGEVFTFTVKSSDPQWFFCSVGYADAILTPLGTANDHELTPRP